MSTVRAPASTSDTVSFLRVAGVIAGSVVALNLIFFALSTLYFNSHTTYVVGIGELPAYGSEDALHVRLAFALFSGIVGGAAILAMLNKPVVGHGIALIMGLGSFFAGALALSRGMPSALYGALLVLGCLMPYLAYRSWTGSRAAWSFLIAICSVYAVVLFFGAPTVHRVLGLGLWTSLILPGLNLVAFVTLIQIRAKYRD